MRSVVILLGVAALGHALYQIGQKSLPNQANPMVLLMGIYGISFLLAALAAPWFRTEGVPHGFGHWVSWPVLGVSVGVLLIEWGFLMVYRTGGGLQWAGIAVSGLATLILVPVAVLHFREPLQLHRLLGMAMTLGGLLLLTWKRSGRTLP